MRGETVIFSRSGGSGRRHAAEEPQRSPEDAPPDSEPDFGPYDVIEEPDSEYLDLGSLKIPTIAGVEVRVQANNEGVVQQIVLSTSDSVLQLAVFAAPRNEGIWDEVRGNIRKSLSDEGMAAEEMPGDYGQELLARVRGDAGMNDIRFIGIDGPRWMVRAIYQGAAASEPAAAGPLADCLRGLVVDRGKEAMPAEEALPLRLPREMAEAAKAQMEAQAQAAAGDPSVQPDRQIAPHADADSTQGGAVYGGHASTNITNGSVADPGPGSRRAANGRAPQPDGGYPPANSTSDHPIAGNDQRRRPSPRPRRPE